MSLTNWLRCGNIFTMELLQIKEEFTQPNPTNTSVYLGSIPINLSAISRASGIDVSCLSRIFSGKRAPSVHISTRIAATIGLRLDEFVALLRTTNGIPERKRATQN